MNDKPIIKMKNELPFSEFIDPYAITEIVSSRTYRNGEWAKLTQLKDFTNGIQKVVLPVDISKFQIVVVTHVVPGRVIKTHQHDDEPMFRYVTHGSFFLNGELYKAGEWVIVPTGFPYEIRTEEGYSTMAGYGMSCECSGVGGH